MRAPWLAITLAVLVDGCAGLTGALLSEAWLASRRGALVGFATGVILGVAFLDILPEALVNGGTKTILGIALASFSCTAALEWWLGHRRSRHDAHTILPAMLLGSDGLHNAGDGAAIAAAFIASPRLGVATALAVIVHEVPQEVGDYAILRSSGMSRGRAAVALSLVQLTAGLGALVAILVASVWTSAIRYLLGIAAGTFLYIGSSDLLPELLHESPEGRAGWQAILGFLAGVAVAVTSALFD